MSCRAESHSENTPKSKLNGTSSSFIERIGSMTHQDICCQVSHAKASLENILKQFQICQVHCHAAIGTAWIQNDDDYLSTMMN